MGKVVRIWIAALLLLLSSNISTAEPLIINAKLTPENPSIGDTVGIYITIQGLQDESVQVVTKLNGPIFKVIDKVTGESLPFNTVKQNAIDFRIGQGQTVEIVVIGELSQTGTLATLFPNAYAVEFGDNHQSQLTDSKKNQDDSNEYDDLKRLLGNLHARYLDVRQIIPERMQLIIEEKLKDVQDQLGSRNFREAKAELNELEGIITEYEKSKEGQTFQNIASIVAALAMISLGAVLAWKFYLSPGAEDAEENEVYTNWRLWR